MASNTHSDAWNATTLRASLFACFLLICGALCTTVTAQRLSYFPLEQGNSWTYRVVPHGLPPSHSFDTVITVGADTLMPNGKRYMRTGWGALRVDSTTGIVWKYAPYPSRPLTDSTRHCTDTTEVEFINLSVDSASTYTLCPGPPAWQVSVPDTLTSIGQLPIQRKALYWSQWLESRSFADSIGLFFIEYNMFVYTTWELTRAQVYGKVFTPVEMEYFRAHADDGSVTLQWRTARETDNMCFEVQRRRAGSGADAWKVLGFVPAQGDYTVYRYVDLLTNASLEHGPLSYRLRQIDYSGAYWFSPRIEVANVPEGIGPVTLELFPVPVCDKATVLVTGLTSRTISYSVYNVEGTRITSGWRAVSTEPTTELPLRLTGFPAGMYYILVRDGNTVHGMTFPFLPRH